MKPAVEEQKEFTTRELSQYDGKDGKPVYVAFGGTVYDVSDSPLWNKGTHFRRHLPGADLTDQLGCAPHGADVFGRPGIQVVGKLVMEPGEDPVPPLLGVVYRKFPFLRRHTHPASVHFPIAFLTAASAFTLINLVFPGLFGVDHDMTAFLMLVLATMFTPVAIATGVVSWKVNYQLRRYRRIRNLITLSILILFLEAACLYLRISGLSNSGLTEVVYSGLMLLLGPVAAVTGYNGGQMIFPTDP